MKKLIMACLVLCSLSWIEVNAETKDNKTAPFEPFAHCADATSYAAEQLAAVLKLLNYQGAPISLCRSNEIPATAAWSKLVGYESHPYIKWKQVPVVELYVAYNPALLQSMETAAPNHYMVTALFAHEVGHHIKEHVQFDHPYLAYDDPWPYEVAADYYVGYALARQQAKAKDLQLVMMNMFSLWSDINHPDARARLKSLAQGWIDGGGAAMSTDTLETLHTVMLTQNRW